ncbi:MAG: filamentous hemagglutinin N-terminal domain-containing protein [Acidobacteriota bacterium]
MATERREQRTTTLRKRALPSIEMDAAAGPWMRARSFMHRDAHGDYLRRLLRFEERLSYSRRPLRAAGRAGSRGGLLSTTALVGAVALAWVSPGALAAPTGGTVAAGSATISTTGSVTQITTNSQRTIINWQGLSIAPGETAKFVQPSSSSATLNRVVGPDPSLLLGTLTSNGQVYLINRNGIVVGQGARIETAGFVASTLDVPDTAFMSGGALKFSGTSTATIQNLGTINATLGDVVLIGQPFNDAPQNSFVHFNTWYTASETFDGAAFTIFFKEGPPDVLPDGRELEVPFDQIRLIGRDFPIGFGMLYGQQNRKAPDAIAQGSSYDMLPDEFSAMPRPLYLDVENPKTDLLGYELRPEVYAQNVLARISTAAGGDEVSCKELGDILPLIQNPQAQLDYKTLCAPRDHDSAGVAIGSPRPPSTPTRDRHFVRAVQR